MKLLKKFKDYFKEEPKSVYSALNLTKREVKEFFFPLLDVLDSHMLKSSVHRHKDDEQVHCISLECIIDIDNFDDVSKITKQNIKRFNSYYKDKGLIADARVVNREERTTIPLPDTAQEMKEIFTEASNSVNFWVSIYHPLDFANTSAYKRGIKDKPTNGYAFYADYL